MSGRCYGSTDSTCYLRDVWGGSLTGSRLRWFSLDAGYFFGPYDYPPAAAFSARFYSGAKLKV